jgi:UbiD family decarboxylase
LQVKKRQPSDEGRQGQAALIALATYSELKNIILVDEDVDIFDSDDILWAMTTRMQGDVSITNIPGSAATSWIRPSRRITAPRFAATAFPARRSSTARCRGR